MQRSRGCAYFIIDTNAEYVLSGWADDENIRVIGTRLRSVAKNLDENSRSTVAVGIDAPRKACEQPREYFWDRATNSWRLRKPHERGYGRHCEVVIKALGLGNPQWTPFGDDAPEWMLLGFEVFRVFQEFVCVCEVFPTASYRMLEDDTEIKAHLSFAHFSRGPKDMLDACTAAVTVREFVQGRGTEVGGGDCMGTIILPKPISDSAISQVLNWPINKS